MDPNVTLDNLRDRVRELVELVDSGGHDAEYLATLASEACDYFTALDGWLERGGFLPRQWMECNGASRRET